MAGQSPLDVDALLPVLNHINLGVYITDLDRRILLWNRKAEEITGYRAADIVGTACHDDVLVHVDQNQNPLCSSELCPLHRAMTLGKESDEPVIVFAKKADGQRIAVSVSVAPLRDAAGNVVGGIEAFRDETRRILDLEFARKIQHGLLPKSLPQDPNMRFDARYYPCDLVGGDFYDLRTVAPRRFGVLLADVSGHGVSAALYSTWLRSLCDSASALAPSPDEFIATMNRELTRVTLDESFATAFYAVVDAEHREVTYCNAGHPPPLHYHAATRETTELHAAGLPLGILHQEVYGAATIRLDPGDVILCYTDGVTEVTDRQGDMLGREGLAELLDRELSKLHADGADLLDRLYHRVVELCGDISLPDDVLLLSITGTAAPPEFNI